MTSLEEVRCDEGSEDDVEPAAGHADTVFNTAEIFALTHEAEELQEADDDDDEMARDDNDLHSTRFTPNMAAELDAALGIQQQGRQGEKRSRKKPKKPRRKASELPPALVGMMGEANTLYATAEYDEAATMLLEVVRLAPSCPDPYQTLGLIYEGMGQHKKALEYQMLAAHLLPKDVEGWKQVFRNWMAFGNIAQAAYCMQKAYKLAPRDAELLTMRSSLLAQQADMLDTVESYRKALDGFEQLAAVCEPDLTTAMDSARFSHHACEQCRQRLQHECTIRTRGIALIELALQCEENADSVTDPTGLLSTLNVLMELYLEDSAYSAGVKLIERWKNHVARLPLDLTGKYAICLIYLDRPVEAQRHVDDLRAHDATTYADLYFEVAEAYNSCGRQMEALELYQQARKSPQFDLPEVWYKIGACHKTLGQIEPAKQILQQVHSAAPTFEQGTKMLIEVYRECGEFAQALTTIQATSQASSSTMMTEDGRLSELRLLELELMLQQGLEAEFLEGCLEPLLLELRGRVKMQGSNPEQADPANQSTKKSRRRFVAIGLVSMEPEAVSQLVVTAARALCGQNRGDEAIELIKTALGTDLFAGENKPQFMHSLRLVLVELSWRSGNLLEAYKSMCIYCLQQPYSVDAWCLYNQLAQRAGMWYKIHRPLIRALLKHPDSVPMTLLTGHHMSASGRLKLAVGLYFRALRAMPDQPLINLCIGTSLLGLSMNKNAVQRHKVLLDAFAFFEQYRAQRKMPHETDYNYGRAYQQLGLFHLAIPYYKKVLACTHKSNTLQREAAFNLSLIYSRSGSPALASQILRTHVRI